MCFNSLKVYYQSVTIVYDLIQEVTQVDGLGEKDVEYLKNLVIASEKTIRVNQLHLNQNGRHAKDLEKMIESFLTKLYSNRRIKENYLDEKQVCSFLTQSPIISFFNLLTIQSSFHLIQTCSFFQIIQNQFLLQKTGYYFSNFIFHKKAPL